jgi:hypothetical protein
MTHSFKGFVMFCNDFQLLKIWRDKSILPQMTLDIIENLMKVTQSISQSTAQRAPKVPTEEFHAVVCSDPSELPLLLERIVLVLKNSCFLTSFVATTSINNATTTY